MAWLAPALAARAPEHGSGVPSCSAVVVLRRSLLVPMATADAVELRQLRRGAPLDVCPLFMPRHGLRRACGVLYGAAAGIRIPGGKLENSRVLSFTNPYSTSRIPLSLVSSDISAELILVLVTHVVHHSR